jgi:hypothetical protein
MRIMLRATWTVLLLALLLGSLALNVAMFVGGSLYSAASSFVGATTGYRTVAARHAAEVADLRQDLNAERVARNNLRSEVAELSDDVVSERRVSTKLRGELAEATGELTVARRQLRDMTQDIVNFRGRRVAVSEAVEQTADRISQRARNSASREVASMAGESLPWIGTAVIVGVTALELNDLCETLIDMNELKRAFDPSLDPKEGAATVCSIEVPTRRELWETAKASPGLAWERARAAAPSMEALPDFAVGEIDWAGYQATLSSSMSRAYDVTGNAVRGAVDATADSASSVWEWLLEDDPPPDDVEAEIQVD